MDGTPRRRTFELLDAGRHADLLSRSVDFGLMALISLNVLAVLLESLPELGGPYAAQFELFENASVLIFSVEYVLRVWSSIEDDEFGGHPLKARLRFMMSKPPVKAACRGVS